MTSGETERDPVGDVETEGHPVGDVETDGDPVGYVLTKVARQIGNDEEKSWRLHLNAPRWSVGKGRAHSEWFAIGLYLIAGVLALAGSILAVHFLDRFLPGSAGGLGHNDRSSPTRSANRSVVCRCAYLCRRGGRGSAWVPRGEARG